ncbi:MAG TPA: hypothetical protein VFD13_02405 [Candidatus Kapabacteria bacterium]|nr:hypothetical protein [Candidatus Kapabacteria bacterium]
MIQTQIAIPENLDIILASLATQQGKKKEDIIIEAVNAYVHEEHTPEEILAMRRQAFGMWKDRTDLPDFEKLGRSRSLNWDQ